MRKAFLLLSIAVWMVALAGCAQSRLETDYGTSHKLAIYNQTLNPDAERNLAPVEGMDGKAAQAAVDKYEKGFEKTAPAPSYTFSIGTQGK
jgi:hypothetical protein